MIINQSDLFSFISGVLIPFGFVRKKDCWYIEFDEYICFFLLKKAHAGKYENLIGSFYKPYLENIEAFPVFYKNDIKFSLQDLGVNSGEIDAFDLEHNYSNKTREAIIQNLLVENVIPFIEEISTSLNIKNAMVKYPLLPYSTNIELRKLLQINI